jgi:uncharacterized protein YfaT (DUF1175 family)
MRRRSHFIAVLPLFLSGAALGLTNRALTEEKRSFFDTRLLRVALEQAEHPSGYWDAGQRDCAGFVRFVYYRSLGPAAKKWWDAQGRLKDFASAEDLVHYNFRFLSREIDASLIRNGDLLAFYSEDKPFKDRWHLMLALKSPYSARSLLFIYHNGAEGEQAAVRKVELSELMNVPGGEWRPEASNPRFRGVYRWKGWETIL